MGNDRGEDNARIVELERRIESLMERERHNRRTFGGLTVGNWLSILAIAVTVSLAGLGASKSIATALFYDKAKGEVLEANFESHKINETAADIKRDAATLATKQELKEEMRELRKEQRATHDDVIKIAERLNVKNLNGKRNRQK